MNDGWFEVEERVDYAQKPLDEWHDEHKGKPVEPGTRVVVIDTRGRDERVSGARPRSQPG